MCIFKYKLQNIIDSIEPLQFIYLSICLSAYPSIYLDGTC